MNVQVVDISLVYIHTYFNRVSWLRQIQKWCHVGDHSVSGARFKHVSSNLTNFSVILTNFWQRYIGVDVTDLFAFKESVFCIARHDQRDLCERDRFWIYVAIECWRSSGPFLTSPLGKNFDPQGRSCPPGDKYLQNTSRMPTEQRHIIKFAPRGKLWPPGAKLSPRGGFCPLGVKLSPGGWASMFAPPLFNSIECTPLVVNEGVDIPRREQISPLGARGEVKNGPKCNM
jgi:hypothetical protein